MVLKPGGDPMGAAIMDYHRSGKADVLRVFSPDFDEDEIPVADLFREYDEMPQSQQNHVHNGLGYHGEQLQNLHKN